MSGTGNKMRIARYLAAAGLGSRRRCERLVAEGGVRINGQATTSPATNVDPESDRVTYRGSPVTIDPRRYIVVNKPRGYTCSARDRHAVKLVTELFPRDAPRLFTVGRLDRDSQGLLICTNDGEFAQRIAHPRHQVPKIYQVLVEGRVTERKLVRLTNGIADRGDVLKAVDAGLLRQTDRGTWLRIVVTEGKKREIRRMCASCGWSVRTLIRTAVGPVELGTLAEGNWRELSAGERRALLKTALQPGR